MTIKLHVFPLSPRAFKVLFAANQLGIDYQMVFVDFGKQAQKTPGFTALNPNQRMPVLEDDGYVLWESNAIVQYLASLRPESGLLPTDLKARMTAVKWQFWETSHFDLLARSSCSNASSSRCSAAATRPSPKSSAEKSCWRACAPFWMAHCRRHAMSPARRCR